jgi:type I restriction enzyme S subunit
MSPDALTVAEPTLLPAGWAWAQLGDLCRGPQYGWTTSAAQIGELKLLRTTDISSGSISWNDVPYCQEMPVDTEKYLLNDGDILISRAGSVGKSFLISKPERAIFASYLVRFQPQISPKYVYYFLQTGAYWRQISDKTAGIAIPNVNASKLKSVAIPLAPICEQWRIVARIDELFAEIDEGEATLDRARQGLNIWRRALLKAAVTGELTRDWREANHPAETGAALLARIRAKREGLSATRGRRGVTTLPLNTSTFPELPEGWAWARMHELGEVSGGLTKNPDREGFPRKLPYLRVANVQMGRLDLTEMLEIGVRREEQGRLLLFQNDLLIVEGNGSIDQIGRCALWNDEIRPCAHQNHIIKVRFSEPALSSWALRWLLSPSGRGAIKNVASSTSGLHTLSISKIQNLPIPVPSLKEARLALTVLEESLAAGSDADAECEKLIRDRTALRLSILKAAFEGQLVPQDPTDEPASELLSRLRSNYAGNGARRRKGRAAADFSHPSLSGLTRQSVDPRVEPAGDAK